MLKKKIKKRLNNEEGSGLVLALMVLLVLSVLGASLGVLTIGSFKLADVNRDSNSAYYIAEAGANLAYEELKKDVNAAYTSSSSDSLFFSSIDKKIKDYFYGEDVFEPQYADQPTAEVNIEPPKGVGEEREYIIKSIGKIAGKKRIVEKKVDVTWKSKSTGGGSLDLPGNAAVINKGELDLEGDIKIIGDIYLGGKVKDKYKEFVTGTIKENQEEKINNIFARIEEYVKDLKATKPIKPPNEGEYATEIKDLKLEVQNKKIDIGNKNVIMFFEDLDLNATTIDIFGGGSLTIVATGDVKIKGSVINSSENVAIFADEFILEHSAFNVNGDLKIVVNEEVEIKDSEFFSSGNTDIFAEEFLLDNSKFNAEGIMTITVSDDVKIKNNSKFSSSGKNSRIISTSDEDIKIESGSKVYAQIIAPKSENIEIEDSEIWGSIIAEKVKMQGKSSLIYEPSDFNGSSSGSGTGDSAVDIEDLIASEPAIESGK